MWYEKILSLFSFCQSCLQPSNDVFCQRCHRLIEYFGFFDFYENNAISLMLYNDLSAGILIEIKYRKNFFLINYFAQSLSKELAKIMDPKKQYYIIPVPSHWRRTLERGYSPVECLSFYLEKYLKKNFAVTIKKIITKGSNLLQKNAKNDMERMNNARRVYSLSEQIPQHVTSILIDDMITSGATILSCIEIIPTEVIIASICCSKRFFPTLKKIIN